MFDNIRNLTALMGQAGQFREKIEQFQAELASKSVEAESGAGAVRVVMNGKFEVLAIRLDRAMIQTLAGSGAEADQNMIEELIQAGVNAAVAKVQDLVRQEMAQVTGGLNIPGLDKLLS